jgi:DTW domain-containing protein YfiP
MLSLSLARVAASLELLVRVAEAKRALLLLMHELEVHKATWTFDQISNILYSHL